MRGLSIILCAYNDSEYIRDCLNNLKNIVDTVDFPVEVIIKNQPSLNNSEDIIKNEFPWVKLILGENVGLSKAYNLALSLALYDFILFLGTDAFPEKETIAGLFHFFETNPEVGAGTCKLVLANGEPDMDAHRSFPTLRNSIFKFLGLGKLFPKSSFFNEYFLPKMDMSKPHEIDLLISHFMFTRKKLIQDLGGFDEDFFLYGEDVDICYRIKQSGKKIMYFPQWTALHLKGASLGIRKTTRQKFKQPLKHRLEVQKLSAQAMELFLKKHYLTKYPRFVVWIMIYATRILGKIRVIVESIK